MRLSNSRARCDSTSIRLVDFAERAATTAAEMDAQAAIAATRIVIHHAGPPPADALTFFKV
jgi:hypothetical protein